MSPYFDDFETKLHDAARAYVAVNDSVPGRHGRARQRTRTTFSALPALLSAAVAVLIAVVALTALSHRHSTRQSADRPVRAARAQLINSLGLLRTPQTRADLNLKLPSPLNLLSPHLKYSKRGMAIREAELRMAGYPRLDPLLVRAITTPDGDHVSLFPTTFLPSGTAARTEGLLVLFNTPRNGETSGNGPRPMSVEDFRTHGFATFIDDDHGAIIVPDGVTNITIDSIASIISRGPRITVNQTRITPQSVPVHHNIATIRIRRLGGSSRLPTGFAIADVRVDVTWTTITGTTIRTTTDLQNVYIYVHHHGRPLPVPHLGHRPSHGLVTILSPRGHRGASGSRARRG
jgi:hypothetical protein